MTAASIRTVGYLRPGGVGTKTAFTTIKSTAVAKTTASKICTACAGVITPIYAANDMQGFSDAMERLVGKIHVFGFWFFVGIGMYEIIRAVLKGDLEKVGRVITQISLAYVAFASFAQILRWLGALVS